MPCYEPNCFTTENVTILYLTPKTTTGSNDTQGNESKGHQGTDGSGPLSHDSEIGLIFLFSLTTILAIVGNCFVVLVFARGRRSRTDLRPFLINLAIADLIMAIFCMPFTFITTMLDNTWIFSRPMCPIVLFIQLLSVSASVFTNMAIGTDRFLVVMFPLRSRLTNKKAKYVIGAIWTCSAALASVQFKVAKAEMVYGNMICQEWWATETMRKIYTVCLFVITYVIPLTSLSITYSIVGILLWKRTAPGNRDHTRDMHQLRSKRKVVKMLVIVVAMFGICWLPLHLFTLLYDFYPQVLITLPNDTLTSLFISCHWLAMSNSFANPIIYGFTNESFRADLVTLFYMWFPCCVCLTKMMPRHSSGSTYETVVYRRQSFYKQGAKLADLVTLFYMWFPCCVCLTKMMPRHSSGSTYETVVYRRQSLYKQGAKLADLVTLFYMWFPCCVCLTKMMPRHSSGSTYETVVYRRQSLYKQGAKIGGTYQTRTVRSERSNKPYLNGHNSRNRYEYSDISKIDKNKNRSETLANGCGLRVVIATNEDKELLRLSPISRVSISYNSEATNNDAETDLRPNGNT